MADIEFSCPQCSLVLAAPEEMVGELVECPECKYRMEVPGGDVEASCGDSSVCPECGQAMPEGSVLCMGCGFHTGLGKKITTEFQ